MNRMKLMKKFIMPCGLCAAVPAIKAAKPTDDGGNKVNNEKNLIKPSELPIYTLDKTEKKENLSNENEKPNVLEEGIGSVRRSVSDFFKQFTDYTDSVANVINTGREHSKITLEYLREESNTLPRIGAVGLGGLSGLILSLRGGKFKRLVYTSTGALLVASICYPKEAQEGVVLAKYYANVGYNFFYGIKPEDGKPSEIPWPEIPKIPTNFSEFSELASNTGSWAVSTVGDLFNKATEMVSGSAEETKKDGKEKKQ